MGRWLAILGLLVLAACQQPQATGPAPENSLLGDANKDIPSDWNAPGEAKESKYFSAEFKATRNQMIVLMLGSCYRQLRDKADLDRCFRTELIRTFDDSGQAKQYCEKQSNIDAYTDCVVLGNVAVDLAQRLDSSVRIEPELWSGRRGFADFLGKVAVVGGVTACGDAKTELSATTCMFDWLLAKLSLPDSMARKCSPDLVAEERGACIGQAVTIRFVRDHLSRSGGINA